MKKLVAVLITALIFLVPTVFGQTSYGDSWDAEFSPDGSLLAYTCVPRNDGQDREICILRIEDQTVRHLTDVEYGSLYAPDWSPDGTKIVASGSMDGVQGMFLIDLNSENREIISTLATSTDSHVMFYSPHWSPDSQTIAFNCHDWYEREDICLIDVESKNITYLTYSWAGNYFKDPSWTEDGDLIFSGSKNGQAAIYRYDTETELSLVLAEIACSSPSINGNMLVCSDCQGTYAINLATNAVSLILPGMFPDFSPSGEQIVYTVAENGIYNLYMANADGSDQVCLTCE